MLDRSGSVGKAGFERQLGFVRSFLNFFEVAPNASRVAVISFSDDTKVHADLLKEPGNRCQLELHLQNASYEKHQATNTGAGLQEARRVFGSSRSNATKVLVLVTDGLETMGPNPVAEAKRLKQEDVEIFVFGIGRSIANSLNALASSEDHVYEFESFSEFERTYDEDDRARPTMVDSPRKCDHLCRSPYRGQPDDPGCCDKNAVCGCSLTDGLSNCRCRPGFTGNGRIGECTPCRPGRYKDTLGSGDCLSCPENSSTPHEGSSSVKDCVCKEGYAGDPGAGVKCSVVKCPPLQAPNHGRMLPCGNLYEDVCTFECDGQHTLESDDSEMRTCQQDGTWSGTTAVCAERQCGQPQDLVNGEITDCDSPWRVNDTCMFRCYGGYTLRGPSRRTCLEGGTWSGNDAACAPVECPPPPVVENSQGLGSHGGTRPYKYKEYFVPRCHAGFRLRGPAVLYCNEQGRWDSGTSDHSTPKCVDVTPPEISCPPDITADTQAGKATALVSWEKPRYTDNDDAGLVLQQIPVHYVSGQELRIGEHRISFRVLDNARNAANCTFTITVVDKENPLVIFCPSDISLNTTQDDVVVTWKEPEFVDNSGEKPRVRKNILSGTAFKHGEHNVIYEAYDRERNRAKCAFKVKVSRSECPYHPAPQNGALSCDMGMYGQFCEPYCNEHFDFIEEPADWYICAKDLRWYTIPEGKPVPWPDCVRPSSPTEAKRSYHGRYYSGDCTSPETQAAIRKAFSENFRSALSKLPICTSGNACRLNDVVVTCGKVTDHRGPISVRVRRSARSVLADPAASIAGVDAEIVLKMDVDGTFGNDTEEYAAVVDEILDGISEISPSVLKKVSDEENVNVRMDLIDYTADDMVIVCADGETISGQGCAKCPKGTFHDKSQGRCSPCPVGSYQDQDGAVACKLCPEGAATATPKSDSVDDCQLACSPGTYSMNGLETCLACPVGTYQNESQQTRCKPCPTGSSTDAFGSRNISDCKNYCAPGTHSDTGLQPCLPCERGSYQAHSGRKSCDQCPAPRTTLEEGSRSRFDCVEVDHCASSPCREGKCVAHRHGFTCEEGQEHRSAEVEEAA